jgi:hypothetical protein
MVLVSAITLVLPLELSRGEGWGFINRYNLATLLCLYQARDWLSNVICRGPFCFH